MGKECLSFLKNHVIDVVVLTFFYTLCAVILLVGFMVGPIGYVNERESWETGTCICTATNTYDRSDYHYFTATFIVSWFNGTIPTNSTGQTPGIVGDQDIVIGEDYTCVIDPNSIYDEILTVYPTTWLNSWQTMYIIWLILTLITAVLFFGLILCCGFLGSVSSDVTIPASVELLEEENETWKNSLANTLDNASPLNPNTMARDVTSWMSPFGGSAFSVAFSDTSPSKQNVQIDNMYKIADEYGKELHNAVAKFYANYEMDLRSCVTDWLEKTGITNNVLQRTSTGNLPAEGEWSIVHSNTQIEGTNAKEPLDNILKVSLCEDTTSGNKSLAGMFCFSLGAIFIFFLGICGYILVFMFGTPEDSFLSGCLDYIFGLEGLLFVFWGFYNLWQTIIKFLVYKSLNNKNIATFMHKYLRGWSNTFDTANKTYFIIFKEEYSITTNRYGLKFIRVYLPKENVWFVEVTPKLPKEITIAQAEIFIINT